MVFYSLLKQTNVTKEKRNNESRSQGNNPLAECETLSWGLHLPLYLANFVNIEVLHMSLDLITVYYNKTILNPNITESVDDRDLHLSILSHN